MTRRWRKAHSPHLRVLGGGAAERSRIRSRVPTRERFHRFPRQRLPFWRETQPSSEIGKQHDNFAARLGVRIRQFANAPIRKYRTHGYGAVMLLTSLRPTIW